MLLFSKRATKEQHQQPNIDEEHPVTVRERGREGEILCEQWAVLS